MERGNIRYRSADLYPQALFKREIIRGETLEIYIGRSRSWLCSRESWQGKGKRNGLSIDMI